MLYAKTGRYIACRDLIDREALDNGYEGRGQSFATGPL